MPVRGPGCRLLQNTVSIFMETVSQLPGLHFPDPDPSSFSSLAVVKLLGSGLIATALEFLGPFHNALFLRIGFGLGLGHGSVQKSLVPVRYLTVLFWISARVCPSEWVSGRTPPVRSSRQPTSRNHRSHSALLWGLTATISRCYVDKFLAKDKNHESSIRIYGVPNDPCFSLAQV